MRFKITNILRLGVHGSVQWDITADGLWYDEAKHMFTEKPDGQNDYSNKCKEYSGKMDARKIARLLNYWKLPKGTPLTFTGWYSVPNKNFSIMVEKFNVTITDDKYRTRRFKWKYKRTYKFNGYELTGKEMEEVERDMYYLHGVIERLKKEGKWNIEDTK